MIWYQLPYDVEKNSIFIEFNVSLKNADNYTDFPNDRRHK